MSLRTYARLCRQTGKQTVGKHSGNKALMHACKQASTCTCTCVYIHISTYSHLCIQNCRSMFTDIRPPLCFSYVKPILCQTYIFSLCVWVSCVCMCVCTHIILELFAQKNVWDFYFFLYFGFAFYLLRIMCHLHMFFNALHR